MEKMKAIANDVIGISKLDTRTLNYVLKQQQQQQEFSLKTTTKKKKGEIKEKMTQLDVLMALKPDSAMDYDLHNGKLKFNNKPVFLRETGEMEYPYGDTTFVAALVTAKSLEYSFKNEMKGARVIELGAGTGTLGLVSAALGARDVILTDLDVSIDQLKNNVELNIKNGWLKRGVVKVKELDWFSAKDIEELGSFDFILGSELWFDEDLLEPLNNVLKTLTCSNPSATILMGYQDRLLVDDNDIENAFSKHFRFERIKPEMMDPEFRVVSNKDLRVYQMKRRRE